jgi:2-keto-4-pentenoate hydratase/2-oxohepta-3-ene-1,7-dioic acid hydratase in catechol pathway
MATSSQNAVDNALRFLTAGTTLDKGTVIVTGTPTGIGYTQHPPVLLQDGDNMTVSIEHIGSLTNFVQRNRN